MLTGGCFCGQIRYEVSGKPDHLTNCHCAICRRTTGAPFVTWFSVLLSEFRFMQGQPTQFKSTEKALRTFCPRCGTQLTFQHEDDQLFIDITVCSLDDPEQCPPEDHTYLGDKLNWLDLDDRLPRFIKSRSADASG
ncbi:hypothetical protein AAKU67_002582 [Oxalobacteraceae bacterium GrIS 2.11]